VLPTQRPESVATVHQRQAWQLKRKQSESIPARRNARCQQLRRGRHDRRPSRAKHASQANCINYVAASAFSDSTNDEPDAWPGLTSYEVNTTRMDSRSQLYWQSSTTNTM
jgi:hypothetical protein